MLFPRQPLRKVKGRRAFAASRLNAGLGVTLGIQDDLYHCGYHALEPKLDFLPTLLGYQYLSQVIASQSYQDKRALVQTIISISLTVLEAIGFAIKV